MSAARPEPAAACQHRSTIASCGIKVCLDCGAPLNRAAKAVAALKRETGA